MISKFFGQPPRREGVCSHYVFSSDSQSLGGRCPPSIPSTINTMPSPLTSRLQAPHPAPANLPPLRQDLHPHWEGASPFLPFRLFKAAPQIRRRGLRCFFGQIRAFRNPRWWRSRVQSPPSLQAFKPSRRGWLAGSFLNCVDH